MAMFATIATNAQKQQSPKGLYRLKQFIYEDGRTRNPGYYQYKYAADSVGLLISYSPSPNITQWGNMQVRNYRAQTDTARKSMMSTTTSSCSNGITTNGRE